MQVIFIAHTSIDIKGHTTAKAGYYK